MKKLTILLFTLLLTSSMAFAQNSATTNQTGSENSATVTQSGSNDAAVTQNGDENTAVVEQERTNNDAEINQIDGSVGNLATVKQVTPGRNNEAKITQRGNDNTNLIEQFGNGGKASFTMSGGNENNVTQRQRGTNASSSVEVWGDRNEVLTIQGGSDNGLYLNLRGTGPGADGSSAGAVNDNNVFVNQGGENGLVTGAINGSGNWIDIRQNGMNNSVGTGRFAADGFNISGDHNALNIIQSGIGNNAAATINGYGNSATITQN